jgi:hypothetical protein
MSSSRVGLLPPGSPKEAVLAMRQAFTALSKDEEFIAAAKKAMRFQPRFDVGEDGERLRDEVLRAPPEVVDYVRQYRSGEEVAISSPWAVAQDGQVFGFGGSTNEWTVKERRRHQRK